MVACGTGVARRGRPSAPLARAFGPITSHSANFLHAGTEQCGDAVGVEVGRVSVRLAELRNDLERAKLPLRLAGNP